MECCNSKICYGANWNRRINAKSRKNVGNPIVKSSVETEKQEFSNPSLGRRPVFTAEVENEMAEQIKFLAKIFHGCTAIQIRKIVYQYAEIHNIKHNFNDETQMAGRDWLEGFLRRNKISVRKPEATSVNRITAFNKTEVEVFFKLF